MVTAARVPDSGVPDPRVPGPPAHPDATAPTPGLSDAEVAVRIREGAVNKLPPRSGRSTADIVRANVLTRINAILAALLVLVLATGSWINAAFGLLIVANSAIGIVQELRAKRTLDRLALLSEAHPTIRRANQTTARPRDEIVRDDIIELGPGDQVVVDGEVVESEYLELDESLLTGESDPEPKASGDLVLSGSFVVSGSGAYRATKVGPDAYAAQLAAEASRFTLVRSELQRGINRILRLITWLLVPVGVATVWRQWSHVGGDWREAVLRTAGALVPMVPEGLVLLTSVAFALGVVRLGRRQCLVQELPAIEGLARVDVVCADKTGTLTEPGMTLADVVPLGCPAGEARAHLARLVAADPRPNASLLAIAAALRPTSDAPAPAALSSPPTSDAPAQPAQPPQSPPPPETPTARAPFTSATKWSGASFGDLHLILGAPDVLAAPDTDASEAAQALAATGRRVLLLCSGDRPVDAPDAPGVLTPLALAVLDQRIRPDAAATLRFFADQGVAVKVISGDNAASVGAVTSSLGLDEAAGPPVDARTLTDPETLKAALAASNVFGRVTPHQKREFVAALQAQGRTVAMTGDGVNDVLALKDADLGVAMGSGAPATRAVAQLVLLDDAFATLPHVVAEGRRVIGNIERVANLFLTKTVYSAALALLVVLWGLPFPFLPIHVTITGWFTIGIPAFLLSLAPNHERARPGFARRVLRLGLPAGAVVAAASFVTYLVGLGRPGASAEQVSTASLAALIVAASWVLAVVARPYAWWKVALIAASLAAYAVIFTWTPTQALFLLDSSDTTLMLTALGIGAAGAACVEALWWARSFAFGEPRALWERAS